MRSNCAFMSTVKHHTSDSDTRQPSTHLLRLGAAGKYTLRLAVVRQGITGFLDGRVLSKSTRYDQQYVASSSDSHDGRFNKLDHNEDFVLAPPALSAAVQVAPEAICRSMYSSHDPATEQPHRAQGCPRTAVSYDQTKQIGATVVTADEISAATTASVHGHRMQTEAGKDLPLSLFRLASSSPTSSSSASSTATISHVPPTPDTKPTWELAGPLAMDGTSAAVTQMPAALGLQTLIPKMWSLCYWVFLADDPTDGGQGELGLTD
jgi:hypothetical protein